MVPQPKHPGWSATNCMSGRIYAVQQASTATLTTNFMCQKFCSPKPLPYQLPMPWFQHQQKFSHPHKASLHAVPEKEPVNCNARCVHTSALLPSTLYAASLGFLLPAVHPIQHDQQQQQPQPHQADCAASLAWPVCSSSQTMHHLMTAGAAAPATSAKKQHSRHHVSSGPLLAMAVWQLVPTGQGAIHYQLWHTRLAVQVGGTR